MGARHQTKEMQQPQVHVNQIEGMKGWQLTTVCGSKSFAVDGASATIVC
jgi:hypothetical protein